MKHLGDITKLKGSEVPLTEIVVGGSPCQDLSVAGKRAGLAGARSGLFMEQIRLIKEMRENDRKNGRTDEHIRPRYMVWENVPGALSSPGKRNGEDHRGEDFQAVLTEIVRIVKPDAPDVPLPKDRRWPHAGCLMGIGDNGQPFSVAYRVHDAQFWGVPQRRKRIALVADFGGSTAPEILFERKGLSRDTSESGEARKGTATDAERSIRETISFQERGGKPGAVKESSSNTSGQEHCPPLTTNQCLNSWDVQSKHIQPETGIAEALYSGECRGGGGESYVMQSKVFGISSYDSNAMKSSNPHSGVYEADTARTLDLNGGSPACNQGGMAVVYNGAGITSPINASNPKPGDPCHTLTDDSRNYLVQGADTYNGSLTGDIAATLNATSGDSPTHSGPSVVCLEGNGSRPSHRGDGYSESETMYTLNSTEHHAVCAEPIPINTMVATRTTDENRTTFGIGSSGDPQFTLSSAHSHAVAVENHPNDSRVKISEDGKVQTLSSRMGTGGGNVPMVMEEPYNATTGSFMRAGNSGITETLAAKDYKDPQIVCNSVVRRLTPLECERLQGFPVVRKVRFTEMTKDEYIAWNINEGNIVVDTEYGKVFATRGPGGIKLDEPRELTGTILNGYRVVSIRNGDTKMQCRVHRIVWIAERGVIPDGYVIDHINNDKQDNRLCNLQLLTAAENSTKARADGLYKIHDDSGSAKITDEVHDFIQYVYGNTDLSIRQLAEFFGISKSRVQQIIHDEAWTDIGDWVDSKGKKHKGESDSPRYKALGNSIALPFWKWMAKRMRNYLGDNPTMASLFDGIGGFPLSYQEAGVKPVWASEIEEFPIAVTKIRFPEENK